MAETLLSDRGGYVNSFKELMETTEWEKYGTGNYEKCSDCMAHCGYEASAVSDVFSSPIKAIGVALMDQKLKALWHKRLTCQTQETLNLFLIIMFKRCLMRFTVKRFSLSIYCL